MLLQQFDKLLKETEVRQANADYLSTNLQAIPGIAPADLPANSRAVWHLYPLRYDAESVPWSVARPVHASTDGPRAFLPAAVTPSSITTGCSTRRSTRAASNASGSPND